MSGKLFTCGHFDLVICDEAHRSIYNKYRDIFTYFDAPLVGLTATPKDEIDKNTYEVFELENGVPTYGYDLAQAVKDGYLVDYISVESKLKFIEQGIVYDELSEEDKEVYERNFCRENMVTCRKHISSSALNTWIFNEDTIKQVLNILDDRRYCELIMVKNWVRRLFLPRIMIMQKKYLKYLIKNIHICRIMQRL